MTPSQRNQDSELAALLAPDILVMLEESPGDVAAETEELHPKDLADVAEAMPTDRVAEFLRALPSRRRKLRASYGGNKRAWGVVSNLLHDARCHRMRRTEWPRHDNLIDDA